MTGDAAVADAAVSADAGGVADAALADGLPSAPDLTTVLPAYILGCRSLFAARIVELERTLLPGFPLDCDAVLNQSVGDLSPQGAPTPLCAAGLTANGCADSRLLEPPAIDSLPPGCWSASGPNTNCLRAKWIAPCADGTSSCVVPEARCIDGTRGQAYVQGTPGAKRWVFYMNPGGSPCNGEKCWFNYRYLPTLGSLSSAEALSTLHPDGTSVAAIAGSGITDGSAANELFDYNRVEMNRCGEFASDRVDQIPVADGVSDAVRMAIGSELSPAAINSLPVATRQSFVPVYHQGRNMWRSLFHMLTIAAERDLDGDGTADVDSLANAEVVWIVAGSDAANWLVHAGDGLADLVHEVAPNAQVRLGIDSFLKPGIDSEGRYSPSAPADFNVYDHPYHATGLCGPLTLRDPFTRATVEDVECSDANFLPGVSASRLLGIFERAHMDGRGLRLDESCVAQHTPNLAPCYDMAHVLVHHLSTPHLLVGDRKDPKVRTNELPYAGDGSLSLPSDQAYANRILDLARDIEHYASSDKREEGALALGTVGIVLRNANRMGAPAAAVHVYTGMNERMNLAMTQCNAAGEQVAPRLTIGEMFRHFGDPSTVPDPFLVEDPNDAAGTFWLTGSQCGAGPE